MTQRRMMEELQWEAFEKLPLSQRAPYFKQSSGRPYHCVIAQQFDREALDNLCDLATRIRRIAKNKVGGDFLSGLMRNKRAMLYFTQPSTRTFLSFFSACQVLGFSPAEVRDPSISSEIKGETKEDTIRTFSSFFDLIIMRTPAQGFAEKMAWMLSRTERPVPIINAGSGKDQHPTQALLDIYTLQRSFEKQGGIDGKTVLFCGDLARGRTVRSLSGLLLQYRNVKQIFAAPDALQIGEDILEQLKAAGVEYEVTNDFKGQIKNANAIYMTRLQDEWDNKPGESSKGYKQEDYYFTGEDLQKLSPKGVIMHPLPRRLEISTDCDEDSRAVYWRQERNGMWIRAALIATIFCRDQEITQYYMLNNR